MPRTHLAFLIGTLALIGIPPLSGFWSKDAIIASALATGGVLGIALWIVGIAGALLTGAYAFRLYWIVFRGEPSPLVLEHAEGHGEGHAHGTESTEGHADHAHGEGLLSMQIPVWVLTVLAAIGGLIVIPGLWKPLEEWLEVVTHPLVEPSVVEDYATSGAAVIAGVVGLWAAWALVSTGRELVASRTLRTVLENKLYFDAIYDRLLVRPAQAVAVRLRDGKMRLPSRGGIVRRRDVPGIP